MSDDVWSTRAIKSKLIFSTLYLLSCLLYTPRETLFFSNQTDSAEFITEYGCRATSRIDVIVQCATMWRLADAFRTLAKEQPCRNQANKHNMPNEN